MNRTYHESHCSRGLPEKITCARRGIGADPNEQSSLELRELVRSLVQQIQIGEAQSLAEALHTYIAAAGIGEDRKGWLFRTSRGHDATVLSEQPMN